MYIHITPTLTHDELVPDSNGVKQLYFYRHRSVRARKTMTKKKLHMSTELLDLDEALTFLEEAAHDPEKVAKGSRPQKHSHAPSPEPQRVSIGVDISLCSMCIIHVHTPIDICILALIDLQA